MSRWAGFEQDGGCCGNFDCLVGSNLILQILAKLELRDLMRVRTVCKSWYDAILSPQFLELWKDDEEEVWAVLGIRLEPKESEEEFLQHSWYPVSSSLEDGRQIWYPFRSSSSSSSSGTCSTVRNPFMLPVPILPSGSKFEGLLSSHGLVCGRVLDHDEHSKHNIKLVVGNPLTNAWKPLPLAPLPPHLSPYSYHELFMERHPVSGCYTIVIFLPCCHLVRKTEGHAKCFYNVLQYESKLGTWCKGPTLNDCTDCQGTLLQGSMVGTESWVHTSLPFFSVYDPDGMAWSHMHIAFPDTDDEHVQTFSIIRGFKYRGNYLLTMSLSRMPVGEQDLGIGLGVWELDEKNEYWKLVSETWIKDLHGGGWQGRLMDTRWKCQLVGDILVFSTIYKPRTHGLVPPIAFNLYLFTWTSALMEGEKRWKRDFSRALDYECSYAFTPRLGAQV